MKFQSSKNVVKARNRRVMAETDVAEEASELLFQAEDVAEILADVTGEDIKVEADGDAVTFEVGDDTFTCTAEPTDEIVESSTRVRSRGKVSASSKIRKPNGTSMRNMPRRK